MSFQYRFNIISLRQLDPPRGFTYHQVEHSKADTQYLSIYLLSVTFHALKTRTDASKPRSNTIRIAGFAGLFISEDYEISQAFCRTKVAETSTKNTQRSRSSAWSGTWKILVRTENLMLLLCGPHAYMCRRS